MLNRLNQIRKEEGGFTLVEMLVVIAILGVLASVSVVAIGGMNDQSKKSACKADVAAVQTASDTYASQHNGTFAADIAALKTANLLHGDPAAKTVSADGYALVYTASTGVVTTATGSSCTAS